MGKTTLIELRQDTSDKVSNTSAGEFVVTLNEPLVLNPNDELSVSSVFVDSVAQNSGKIVIDGNNTQFSVQAFLYHNNYNQSPDKDTFKRDGINIVKGVNDGYDYVVCKDTGSQVFNISQITTITIPIDMNYYEDHVKEESNACAFHFVYQNADNQPATFVWTLPDPIKLLPYVKRAGTDGMGNQNQAYFTTDDFFALYKTNPDGFPFDFWPNTLGKNTTFITWDKHNASSGFNSDFSETHSANAFNGINLEPFLFSYNFTIPPNAYEPDELARILTDKLSNGNLYSTDGGLTYTDAINNDQNKYFTDRSFNSPFLKLAGDCRALNAPQTTLYSCRTDGEGVIRITNDDWIVGSSEIGIEWDADQNKFYFSQLHTPYYITKANVSVMGTAMTRVLAHDLTPTDQYYISNKTGGIGFTALAPVDVWFGLMGFNSNILTSFGKAYFNEANYRDIQQAGILLGNLSPIRFSLADGVNTTGNFDGLDSGILKSNPQLKPADLTTLQDTSQIIKQIYAKKPINQSGTLPYYLIEIDGKGINSDIRGTKGSAIRNTKISAIVGRFYQTQSYTSSIDGSGAIPYIHTAGSQPLIIDSFKIRILDPSGTTTTNIQPLNTIFLQHTSAL